jgi:hypothetical protein
MIALKEGFEEGAAVMQEFGQGTQTVVKDGALRVREVMTAWALRQVEEAQRQVKQAPIAKGWRRLRETERWRRAADNFEMTRSLVRSMTETVSKRVSKIPIPKGIFADVYRGISPVILCSPFQGALFFGVKDTIKKALPMMGANPTLTFITSVIIGDAAYWIIRCPAETIKTRVQTGVDDNMFQSVFKIIKTEGWYGFYRGYI